MQICGTRALKAKPTLSVVIPVHNGGVNFRRCLASLSAVDPPPEEIIVVANGDTDGSCRVAEEAGVQVMRIPDACGPARARNLGACKAASDILFFVDADVTVSRDAVARVAGAFHQDPGLAALFGSYDDDPFETNFLSQYKNLFHHYVHGISSEEASTFWGACGAIRREVFLDMKGFDEGYHRPSIEDIELGYRLRRSGHRIRLLKDLHVKHLKHWGIRSLLHADFFCRALPWTRLILREGRMLDDMNLKMSSRLSVMCVFLLCAALAGAILLSCFPGMESWGPGLLAAAALPAFMLLWLNRDVYRFFMNKRGLGFALMTIPWHWFYFLYGGLAFLIGYAGFRFCRFQGIKNEDDTPSR